MNIDVGGRGLGGCSPSNQGKFIEFQAQSGQFESGRINCKPRPQNVGHPLYS